jgi:HPt (histidine-containing phosphotransfer) domain-containing protein
VTSSRNHHLQIQIAELKKQLEELSAELARTQQELEEEIEKRTRAEEALEQNKEIFHSFMKYQPALAFMKDRRGRYLYFKQAYKKIFHTDPGHIIGKTDDDLWDPELAKDIKKNDKAVLSGGMVVNTVERVIIGDNTQHVLIEKFPIFKKGKPFLIGGIAINIDKIQADEDLRILNEAGEPQKKEEKPGAQMTKESDSKLKVSQLPGLDIQEGVRRLDGSWELYVDIVSFFCDDKKNFTRDFRELIEAEDIENALTVAHALKGSAATISATKLRDTAKALEDACRSEDKEAVLKMLDPVQSAIAQVIESSQTLRDLSEKNSQIPDGYKNDPEEIDSIKLIELFRMLDEAYQASDPLASESCINEIRVCFSGGQFGTELTELFHEMSRQADTYHFDNAREILGRLTEKILQQLKKI